MLARLVPINNFIHEFRSTEEKYFLLKGVPVIEQVSGEVARPKFVGDDVIIVFLVKFCVSERYDEGAFRVFIDHFVDFLGHAWILADQDMADIFKPSTVVDRMDLVKYVNRARLELGVFTEYTHNFPVDVEHLRELFQRLHQTIGVPRISYFDLAAGAGEIPVLRQFPEDALFRLPELFDLERLMKPSPHCNIHRIASVLF